MFAASTKPIKKGGGVGGQKIKRPAAKKKTHKGVQVSPRWVRGLEACLLAHAALAKVVVALPAAVQHRVPRERAAALRAGVPVKGPAKAAEEKMPQHSNNNKQERTEIY